MFHLQQTDFFIGRYFVFYFYLFTYFFDGQLSTMPQEEESLGSTDLAQYPMGKESLEMTH